MLLIMVFRSDIEAGRGHAAVSAVVRGKTLRLNGTEITTYPTMYERVVNQLLSTATLSICLSSKLCAQVGLQQQAILPVRPASVRKSTNPILTVGSLVCENVYWEERRGGGGVR
jgi:hypothetical protein